MHAAAGRRLDVAAAACMSWRVITGMDDDDGCDIGWLVVMFCGATDGSTAGSLSLSLDGVTTVIISLLPEVNSDGFKLRSLGIVFCLF